MSPDSASPMLPAPGQRLLALATAVALVAMAAGYLASGPLVHHDSPPAAAAAFTVDVNAADAVELAQLPGLGPATAARIVDHRRSHGPFARPEDLLDVDGIGPATLAGLRPHLRPIQPAAEGPP